MFSFKFSDKFLVILILFSSLIFRVTNINLIEFKGDEATNLFLATRPIFGHAFSPGGTVSSVGILNPPIFNHILFPLTLFSLDPKILSLMIGIINSITIAFFFLVLKRYYSRNIALIATLLLSFSPWSIIYSRKIWPQDFILPFVVLIFFSIHKILIDKNSKYWVVLTASSLFLIQLHQSGLFFTPLVFLFLLLQKAKVNFKFLIIGLAIGILPFLPYIFYEISTKCPDCSTLIAAREKTGRSFLSFFRPFQIMGQGDFRFLLFDDINEFAKRFSFVYELKRIFYIEYILLPVGIFLFWLKNKGLRTLVYIIILLPIFYFIAGVVPHMHYSIILTPFLFLFVSFALSYFISSQNNLIKTTSILIFTILVLNSILFNSSFFQFLKDKKGLRGDYGPIFSVTEKKSKDLFKGYEKDSYYNEMLLTSYLPRDQFYGNTPVGRMIYSKKETEKNISSLEKRLINIPVDPRIQNELIAYYSFDKPTKETLSKLQKKSKEIKGYETVLEMIQKLYIDEGSK